MAEGEGRSIIGGIVEQRRLKALHEASVEEALQATPDFKDRLDVLIRTHIPPPKVKMVKLDDLFSSIGGRKSDQESFPTTLNGKINTSQGITEVHIGATSYPSPQDDGPRDYKVGIQDLDYYLLIEGGKGFLESRDRKSDMPGDPMNVVIGKRYNTWPAWKRGITMDELGRYSEVLDMLETGAVEFSGSTPDIEK